MLITKTERLHCRLNPEGGIAFDVEKRIQKLKKRREIRWKIFDVVQFILIIALFVGTMYFIKLLIPKL